MRLKIILLVYATITLLLMAVGQVERSADELSAEEADSDIYSANLAGYWSLYIDNNENKTGEITLNQINETIFGTGNLILDGTKRDVTALGSVIDEDIDLSFVTFEGDIMLDLDVTAGSNSISGFYHRISANGSSIDGVVMLMPDHIELGKPPSPPSFGEDVEMVIPRSIDSGEYRVSKAGEYIPDGYIVMPVPRPPDYDNDTAIA